MNKALMTAAEVADASTLSKKTVYALAKAGTIPTPIKLSTRRIAWKTDEIRAWLQGSIPVKEVAHVEA